MISIFFLGGTSVVHQWFVHQWFSTRGSFGAQGACGNGRRHFDCHPPEGDGIGI